MSRKYTTLATNQVKEVLDAITEPTLPPDSYKNAMNKLGTFLGEALKEKYKGKSFYIVSTTEDADFLAKGLLTKFDLLSIDYSYACYWNERSTISSIDNLEFKTAPVFKKYEEPNFNRNILVILKSIISSGCVVKHNILSILSRINPDEIAIVSPVSYFNSDSELKSQFQSDISSKFTYLSFAIDDERDDKGNIFPGIGGNVYNRLGFKDQETKNKHTPLLVKERRRSFA